MDEPDAERSEGEDRYHSLLRTSPAPINLFDADGITVWGNDAVLDLLGLDHRDELIGRPVLDFIHPDYHEIASVEIEQVIGAKEPVGPTPMELVREDGEVISIRVSTAPGIYRGEAIGQAIVIDDTPLVDAREALEHQYDLLERIIDTLPDLYYMLGPSGELLDWNQNLLEVTGYPAGELRELTAADLFDPQDADRIVGSISRLLEGGEDIIEGDLVTKDGRRIPYEFHGGLLENAGGEPVCIVGIGREVTERRERDRHLRVVDRLLRHNLRNKLNVVMGYAELIRSDDADLTEEHVGKILQTCRRLLDSMDKGRAIVEVLVESGEPKRIDLRTVLDRRIATFRERHPAVDVRYVRGAPQPVVALPEIDDAISEVLDNAVRHNPTEHPSVAVEFSGTDREISLHVRDDGPPIPEIEQGVFEALDEQPLHHSEGMGLWFVHWVVDRSGGRVEIDRREGPGNSVTLTLPRADVDEEAV